MSQIGLRRRGLTVKYGFEAVVAFGYLGGFEHQVFALNSSYYSVRGVELAGMTKLLDILGIIALIDREVTLA